MPSIIPGFAYDVFISYRQKDNKYDGWVTSFVENLQKELEATFKEDISVYFDSNPYDGLMESHEVGDTIKEKLKCLVFVPVLSRTYCDPRSFAWQHELKAFIEQASSDCFGLKIKLSNGNVAGRVLPIRIHDLDKNDLFLCESLLGSALRGIEFIFRAPGINRPLRPYEDHPEENLRKMSYRDQINKTAIAMEELVRALCADSHTVHQNVGNTRANEFFSYRGKIDAGRLELLLKRLKETRDFMFLDKTTSRKVYSIVSEMLDNIMKYSIQEELPDEKLESWISVKHTDKNIIIGSGNALPAGKTAELEKKLAMLCETASDQLQGIYDQQISLPREKGEKSAGLGFLTMILKSGNKPEYHIEKFSESYSYFELSIPVTPFAGRKLFVQRTYCSPEIYFNPEENRYEISGECRPTDVPGFFEPLLSWIDEFAGYHMHSDHFRDPAVFHLNFDYFNSSSGKYILDFCKRIAAMSSKGMDVSISWHYEEDDIDMLEAGREFSRIAHFAFDFYGKR